MTDFPNTIDRSRVEAKLNHLKELRKSRVATHDVLAGELVENVMTSYHENVLEDLTEGESMVLLEQQAKALAEARAGIGGIDQGISALQELLK